MDIRGLLLGKWVKSEDANYYIKVHQLSESTSNEIAFSAGLLRFLARYNSKSKVRELSIGDIGAKDLRLLVVALANEGILGSLPGIIANGKSKTTLNSITSITSDFRLSGFNLDFLVSGVPPINHNLKSILRGLYLTIGEGSTQKVYDLYYMLQTKHKEVISRDGLVTKLTPLSLVVIESYLATKDKIEPTYINFT